MPGVTPVAPASTARLDVDAIRRDFPILARRVHGRPLAYLDNAATTQKPQAVIDRLVRYYSVENANVHRGVHQISVEATDAYEGARERVRRFLNAAESREVVFVRGATEAVNLVAATYGRARIGAGDEVVISEMEHHSNIVPWQMLCAEKGARLRVVPITDEGAFELDAYERLLGARTRLVAVTHVSNALGTINPVDAIVRLAHDRGDPGARRRRPGRGPPAGRRPGAGVRLLRLLGAQGLRPDRNRGALRPRVAPRGDAAVPGRRGHDPVRVLRRHAVQRRALQVRGRHAAHRRRRGARRGHRVPDDDRGAGSRRGPRARSPRVRHERVGAGGRAAADRYGASKGRDPLVRDGGRSSARHRDDSRPGRHRHPRRPSLLPAPDGPPRRSGDGARLAGGVQHAGEIDALVASLRKVREVFA